MHAVRETGSDIFSPSSLGYLLIVVERGTGVSQATHMTCIVPDSRDEGKHSMNASRYYGGP